MGYHLVAAALLGRDQCVGGGAGRGGSQAPRRAGTRVAGAISKAGDAPPAQDQGPAGIPERGFKVEAVVAVPVVCRVMPFEADIPAGNAQGEFLRSRPQADTHDQTQQQQQDRPSHPDGQPLDPGGFQLREGDPYIRHIRVRGPRADLRLRAVHPSFPSR